MKTTWKLLVELPVPAQTCHSKKQKKQKREVVFYFSRYCNGHLKDIKFLIIKLYLSTINSRTLIVVLIAMLTVFLCFQFDIYFNLDLTLLSIAIIFPLVFTIRGSFRRREKALEHLSQFRSALKTLYYFIMSNERMLPQQMEKVEGILKLISDKTIVHLKTHDPNMGDVDLQINRIYQFILENNAEIGKSVKEKMFRFMNDLHEAIDNLNAIHIHRTPISLKAYCKVFIYIFPVVYSPTIIFNVGLDHHPAIAYFVVILTQFILISLYNIQDHLEYPFDNKGLDDIKLESFKIDR